MSKNMDRKPLLPSKSLSHKVIETVDSLLGNESTNSMPVQVVSDMKFDMTPIKQPENKALSKRQVPKLDPPPAGASPLSERPGPRALHVPEHAHLFPQQRLTEDEGDDEEEEGDDEEEEDHPSVSPPIAYPVEQPMGRKLHPETKTDAITVTVSEMRPDLQNLPTSDKPSTSLVITTNSSPLATTSSSSSTMTDTLLTTTTSATSSATSSATPSATTREKKLGPACSVENPAANPRRPVIPGHLADETKESKQLTRSSQGPSSQGPPVRKTKTHICTIREAIGLSVLSLLFVIILVGLLLDLPGIKRKLDETPGTNAIPDIARICIHPTPAMNLPKPGSPGSVDVFTFAFFDVLTNQTHIVYTHRAKNVQVTNTLQRGVLIYTEVADFTAGLLAIYPEGRDGLGPTHSDVPTDPCILLPITEEKNWGEIACSAAQGKRLAIDVSQMSLGSGVTPVPLPASFFTLPANCPPLEANVEDETRQTDLRNVVSLIGLRRNLPNITLTGMMLGDTLALIQTEFGSAYAQEPALLDRLESAYQRLAFAFLNSTLTQILRPSISFQNHSTTDSLDNCCPAEDQDCAVQIASRPQGIGLLCSRYQNCLGAQDSVWYATHGNQWPMESCSVLDEHRCFCDHNLARSLETPGQTECGDCLEDQFNCDCYVFAWLLKFTLNRRPCWCQGLCQHEPFPYICRVEESCNGWLSEECEVIIHWCERARAYPCSRCHLGPTDDHDSHCL